MATLSSAGGAIALNASNTDVNNASAGGDAVSFLNGGLIDSAGGNLLANWFTASGGAIAGAAAGTAAVALRSGSGALNLNLAGALGYALVFPTRVQLGGSAQSGNISVHADVGNLALSGVSAQTAGALTVQSGSGLASLAGRTVGLTNLQGLTTTGVFSSVTLGDANTSNITGGGAIAASGAVALQTKSGLLWSNAISAGTLVLGGAGDTQSYVFANTGNLIGTLAGHVGAATVYDAQGLTVGSGRDANGATQTGLTAAGSIVLQAVSGDLTLNASVAGVASSGSTAVILSTNRNFINNVGASAVSTGAGGWYIYSTSVVGDYYGNPTVGFLNSGHGAIFNASYSPGVNPAGATAGQNYYIFSQAGSLAPIMWGATTTYSSSSLIAMSGLAVMDPVFGNITVSSSGLATLASKNVGSELITAIGSISAITGSGAANYTTGPTYGAVSITPAALTISGVAVANKTYDATTSGTILGTATLGGAIGSDQVSLSSAALSAAFGSKNAGVETAAIVGYTLAGADGGNYSVVFAPSTATATISQAQITVSGVTVANKTYDATTSATVASAGSITGQT
ncbi:beta strand repeat-containing protein, partial [Caballeronia calidae]|uniref:beta strand repeat-containing protein n=1 Tax=Caballeronia calidae TaxID=1777139 RepID=UPI0018DFE01C